MVAGRIAAVRQDTLTVDPEGSGERILVGGPAWFAWLASASAFKYVGLDGHFTARKEPTSHGRGGFYWKAYRRSDGRLRRAYLGPSERLTLDRLAGAAAALARGERIGSRRSTPVAEGRTEPREHDRAAGADTPLVAQMRLLGTFGLLSGEGGAVAISSPRAQSLLAYLALHRDAPQPRRQISFVLWPDSSEAQARNNLRQLIHQLRRSWPDADRFLSVEASTMSVRADVQLDLDVDEYEGALASALEADRSPDPAASRTAHERAASLCHGELLPGCYDDWIAPDRDRLSQRHARALDRLISLLEEQADYGAAIEYGEQQLRRDPLDERMYRWLMRLHALNQDRSGALRVYHTCVAVLARELGVEPSPPTREAYEELVRQEPAPSSTPGPPSGEGPMAVAWSVSGPSPEAVPLVGRHDEWTLAITAWRRAAGGEAHLLLIGGEAGIGKSRLAEELRDWVGQRGITSARTRAYAAEGRLSYAPAADWLRSAALASGLARLDAASLSEIARLLPELLTRRPDLPRPSARIEDWQRQRFFGALAGAFMAADQPLLLVLDDLQGCDADTLEWLHYLLRVDRAASLLVTGTVRPEEVDRGHPLAALIADLRDAGQMTAIELGPLDPVDTSRLAAHVAGRELTPDEASLIHRETEGNPLFVVETVRAGLFAAEPGRGGDDHATKPGAGGDDHATKPGAGGDDHATKPGADTGQIFPPQRLPPRVQAVIAARLAQLSAPARELAALAATVGRAFTLDVLRQASGLDEDRLVQALDELWRRHVVREHGNNAYDFAHDKIREVAYAEMTDAHRRLLHRRVAQALERVFAASLDDVSAQIAAHYTGAGLADRAAAHYQRAAEVAQRVGANQEAIGLLHRGLSLLGSLPPSLERDAQELGLQTALGVSLVATEGYGAPEVMAVYARSRQLCQLLGRPPSPPILRALALASITHAKFEDGHDLGDHLFSLAERDGDPVLHVEAHYVLAMSLLWTGAFMPARTQLDQALANYDPAQSAAHIGLYTQDPGVVCLIRLALDQWLLGNGQEAARRRAESLHLAEQLAHPFTLGYALNWDSVLHCHRADASTARTQAEAAMALGGEHRMPLWLSFGTILRGWAVAAQGEVEAGIEQMREGMADFKATGSLFMRPFHLGLLAEQYGTLGNVERGLTLLAEALALVERTNERWCEAELYRRRGDLLSRGGSDSEAEVAFRRSLEVARYQGARALELRSAARLAALWRRQGRNREVIRLLGPIVAPVAPVAPGASVPSVGPVAPVAPVGPGARVPSVASVVPVGPGARVPSVASVPPVAPDTDPSDLADARALLASARGAPIPEAPLTLR